MKIKIIAGAFDKVITGLEKSGEQDVSGRFGTIQKEGMLKSAQILDLKIPGNLKRLAIIQFSVKITC